MDRSQSNPVLSVSDADHGVSDFSGTPPDRAAVLAGTVATELLSCRSLEDAEILVIRALQSMTGLDWGAVYRPADDNYRLSSSVNPDHGKLPKTLQARVAGDLLDGVRRIGSAADRDLGPRMKGAKLVVRLDSEFGSNAALLILGAPDPAGRPAVTLRSAEAIAEVASAGLRNLELLERLRSEVFVDFITHCYNRRAFEDHLNVELVRAKRYERPLCLLLIDLDDFKDINDVLGHQAGDYVLERVGEVLRSTFRTTDYVCRFGGDEFAVIFPETPKEEVLRLAERLRRQVSSLFPDTTIPSSLTASIGVASFPLDGGRAEDLVKAADQAMYRAKEAGRNRVVPA